MIVKSKIAWLKATSVILMLGLLLQSYAYINREGGSRHNVNLVAAHAKAGPGFVPATAFQSDAVQYAASDEVYRQKINELVFTLLWLSVMVVFCFGFVRR